MILGRYEDHEIIMVEFYQRDYFAESPEVIIYSITDSFTLVVAFSAVVVKNSKVGFPNRFATFAWLSQTASPSSAY